MKAARKLDWSHLGKNLVIALSLVAAGFFVAWLRFRPHLTSQSTFSDGARQYEGVAAEPIRFAVWDEIEPLRGETAGDDAAHRPTLSPDGRWLVFAGGERGLSADLWIGEMVEGEARDLRPLYELNTTFDELAPAFGEDALYFASNRPGGEGGFDLWRADFADGEVGAAENLGEGVNGSRDETDPAPLPGSEALAFASNRDTAGRRGHDLYLARPGAAEGWSVEALRELNSYEDDREPSFTRDGRRVVFASDRDGARGSFDLYSSLFEYGTWLPPKALDGLNSGASERGPAPIGDGFSMLFEVEEEGAAAGLFRARSLELFPHPGPVVGWLDLLILITLLVLALLAWLAKRWDSVEVLYKCFLVSVIAHGLLMWWFRGIHPEGEIEPLPSGRAAYEVRLAASRSLSQAARERGGVLEVPASLAEREVGEPSEREAERAEREPVEVVRTRAVRRAEPRAVPLPDRALESEPAPAKVERTPELRLADAERTKKELHDAQVPALALGAAAEGPEREKSPVVAGDPRRGEWEAREVTVASPARRAGRRVERVEVEALPERGAESVVATTTTAPPEVAMVTRLSGPEERFVPLGKEVAELELTAADSRAMELPGIEGPPAKLEVVEAGVGSPDELESEPEPTARPVLTAAAAAETVPEYRRWEREASVESTVPRSELRTPEDREILRAAIGSPEEAVAVETPPTFTPLAGPSRPRSRPSSTPLPTPSRFRAGGARPEVTPGARPVRTEERIASAEEAVQPAQKFEHTPYRARFGPAKARALEEFGGGVETEAAVAAGLAYLASRQGAEGFWGDPRFSDDKYGYVLVGKTGLALLAFLGAGHTQASGTEHSEVVERAVDFLLAVQGERSGHFGGTSAYSHGIATYALAEAYALTREERLRVPLIAAVKQIARHQNQRKGDRKRFGGWSYYYPDDRTYDSWPRVSITAWQVMALESARLGGLEAPEGALENAKQFLLNALDEERGCFRYCHDPSRLNSGYPVLPGSTPAALFALSLLGEDVREERFREAVGFVVARAPRRYRYTGDGDFVSKARGNLYFWYYGSLALLRHGGKEWGQWNAQVKEVLVDAQRADGSWKPLSVYARYAGDEDRDAIYTTAMCVLSLEVYYRYFTPMLASDG